MIAETAMHSTGARWLPGAMAILCGLMAAAPATAPAAWNQPVGGPSPINQADNRNVFEPRLAAIGGGPYVGWAEDDGTNSEIRISRLNAAGTAWEQVVGGASPINQANDKNARDPSLTSVGGVPYVAWAEQDGTNFEIRVSRLNAGGTAWEQVVGGASPINQASDKNAQDPSLTSVGGGPYVAWREDDGTNEEIRVSRLNAGGTAWEQVVGGASPVNQADNENSFEPSLTSVGGVPYLAWREAAGTSRQIRVSRLSAGGTAWEQVVGGASPINHASNQEAQKPSLTSIGGVPYVAFRESDGTNDEMRVSRLEPEFGAGSESAGTTDAMLTAEVRTFGVDYPLAVQYGPGSDLGTQTAALTARSGNADTVQVPQSIGGLAPATGYSWRPVGTDGARLTGSGPVRTFMTAALAPLVDSTAPLFIRAGVSPKRWAVDPKGPAEVRASAKKKKRIPRGTTFTYSLSEAARVVTTIERKTGGRKVGKRCRRQTRANRRKRPCTRYVKFGSLARQGAAGRNRKRFSGKIGRKKLSPGRYRVTLIATDAARNRSRPKRLRYTVVKG